MRGGLPLVLGTGIRGGVSTGSAAKRLVIDLPFSSGVQLHPTSLPGGRLGADAYAWVDWLAEAGQTWWQMLPLGPPDRHRSPYKAASAFAAWPGLLAEPRARVTMVRGARLPRARALLDRGLGALRPARRGRRPGPLRPRVDGAARVRGRARRAHHRRRPDLRRARERRPPCAPRAVPGRRGGGHAARRLHRQGPAVGQPALRLAGDAAARLPLVGRPAAADVRAVRPRPHRPLPRLRLLLVGAGAREARAVRALEARAGARGVRRTRRARSIASCR